MGIGRTSRTLVEPVCVQRISWVVCHPVAKYEVRDGSQWVRRRLVAVFGSPPVTKTNRQLLRVQFFSRFLCNVDALVGNIWLVSGSARAGKKSENNERFARMQMAGGKKIRTQFHLASNAPYSSCDSGRDSIHGASGHLLDGLVEEDGVLRDDPDGPAHRALLHPLQVLVIQHDPAVGDVEEAEQQPDDGGLAAARRTHLARGSQHYRWPDALQSIHEAWQLRYKLRVVTRTGYDSSDYPRQSCAVCHISSDHLWPVGIH